MVSEILYTILISLICSHGSAQTKYCFEYDVAGNQTSVSNCLSLNKISEKKNGLEKDRAPNTYKATAERRFIAYPIRL